MSVSSIGGASAAASYLQSLLPAQSTDRNQRAGSADPVAALLQAFYPNGNAASSDTSKATPAGADANASGGCMAGLPFSPATMTTLMSAQEQQSQANSAVSARAQSLFSQLDADGDGQVGKTEFENVFGSNADMTKVDGLFNALDGNGDGSVSQDELTSAAQASHAHHGHHHHVGGGQSGGGGMFQALMASGVQGATTDTTSNADGSSTTTISYADGSKVSLTSPAASGDSGSSSTDASSAMKANLLEQLIRLQAQSLSVSTTQSLATSQLLTSL